MYLASTLPRGDGSEQPFGPLQKVQVHERLVRWIQVVRPEVDPKQTLQRSSLWSTEEKHSIRSQRCRVTGTLLFEGSLISKSHHGRIPPH